MGILRERIRKKRGRKTTEKPRKKKKQKKKKKRKLNYSFLFPFSPVSRAGLFWIIFFFVLLSMFSCFHLDPLNTGTLSVFFSPSLHLSLPVVLISPFSLFSS
jgi:hypothetical protein